MPFRSRRRLAFIFILSAAAFMSLQLSGISLEDFDNTGQMQDTYGLPTSHHHSSKPAGQGMQDIQLSRNTQQNLKQSEKNGDDHVMIQKDNTQTNHDRLMAVEEAGNKNNAKIHLRNLAASKLQESVVDNGSGPLDNHKQPSTASPLVSVNTTINSTQQQTTKQYEDVVRNLAIDYQTVPPSVFQEENCPVCFGTSMCDQFYAGNIRWDNVSVPATTSSHKNVHIYDGTWIDESENKYLRVTIKQFSNQRMLDNYICQMTSLNISVSNQDSRCDVSTRVHRTKLAGNSATNQQYVRKEIGKLQYRQSTLFSLSKCASQRLLDILHTGYRHSNVAMLSTSLILNPQSLLLKFIHDHIPQLSHYFPLYYGECGHTVVQDSVSSYTPLKQYLPKSWLTRVDLALQLIQMVEDFTKASPDWLVFFGNISYDNIAVSTEGSIKVINLDDMMVVDRAEINKTLAIPTKRPTDPCNEDCLFQYATSITDDPDKQCRKAGTYSQLMHMLVCQRFLSDLASTKVIRFFDHKNMDWADHPGGLLRDSPYELDLRLTELLYECIFESRPGVRRTVAQTLKKMLYVIKRSKIGSAYW